MMNDPHKIADARRLVISFLSGEIDEVPAAQLEFLITHDPDFLDSLGGGASRGASACLSPDILTAFAESPPDRAADMFQSEATHLEECAMCRFEIDALRRVISAEAPAWERFARELDQNDAVLILVGSNWVLADRVTRETAGDLTSAPVQVGAWNFEVSPRRSFALALPKPPLAGSRVALGGSAPLFVEITPTHIVSRKKEEWVVSVKLGRDASVELALIELRSLPNERGPRREQVSRGEEVRFTVEPPRERFLWIWVEGWFGGRDGRKEQDLVEIPLLTGEGASE